MKACVPYLKVIGVAVAIAAMFLSVGLVCGAEPAKPTFAVTVEGGKIVLTPVPPLKFRMIQSGANSASGVVPVVVDGIPDLLDWSLSVTFGNAPPPPIPPKPDPPVPTPNKPVAIYLIYESADLTPATARVRDALPWKKAADAAGIKWLSFDDDTGAAKLPNATKKARDLGLPAVVLIDAKGLAEAVKIPETPEAMEKLVREKGGK